MPIIVESNAGSAELFSSAIGSQTLVVAGLDELRQHLHDDPAEYAVVLGPGVDLEAAAALADTLRVTRPATSVILVRRRVDTGVLAEALRSGMREVVEERDVTGLGASVRRAAEVWHAVNGTANDLPGGHTGKVLTIFSPKGGVGKTTLAVNMALALADHGAKRVCLVDLDLGFGDVAITLQLFPAHSLSDAASSVNNLDSSLLETILTPYRDGVDALLAPVQPDAKESIPPSLIGRTLRILRSEFDFVVVDTAPAFDEFALQAFDETDDVLLVTTLDVPTLKNVKIAIETLGLLNFPAARRHLVLNRADEKVGLTPAKVEGTLGMKIAASIPMSPQVASATNSGEPIIAGAPRHPVSQAIQALASALSSEVADAVLAPASPSRAAHPKRGLLRRSR